MFKYINPGDYRLLNNHSGMSYVNSTDEQKAPNSKVSYTCTATEDYPIVIGQNVKELWIKFDAYVNDNAVIVIEGGSLLANIALLSDRVSVSVGYKTDDPAVEYPINATKEVETEASLGGKVSTFIIHIKSSPYAEKAGIFDLYVNDLKKIHMADLAILDGVDLGIRAISCDTAQSYFSNIIVSDEKVKGRENVITVPILETQTENWSEVTGEGGTKTYTTDQLYAVISQKLNIPALKLALGVDDVSGVNITGLTFQIDELSTNDAEAINAVGKYAKLDNVEYTMGTAMLDSANSVTSSMTKNPATNADWTFEDLENLELVLKTEKVTE